MTGDPSKSLRLHLEEKRSKPPVMRMMDKAAFTVGVSLKTAESGRKIRSGRGMGVGGGHGYGMLTFCMP